MAWFLVALAILFTAGLASTALGRNARLACLIGAAGTLFGGGIVLWRAIGILVSGQPQSLQLAWALPLGSANMEIDALSAVFAAAIAVVTMLAAVYGYRYLQHTGSPHPNSLPKGEGRRTATSFVVPALAGHLPPKGGTTNVCGRLCSPADGKGPEIDSSLGRGARTKNLGVSWFFFNLLTASMFMVVAARNGVLFLISWELMSLASFFLVTQEDEKESVRRAGWIYLVAMHLGTAFLLALFVLLGKNAGSLDFDRLSTAAAPSGVLFLLALVGFGVKAGFIPMHVWLPEAHPAAPSHVSAVMSGVMIKTGIYGLLRVLTLIGPPDWWWGWTLVAVGVVSGVLGVLYALSQHDLKRLLAYHSVENIGIIALGLGVGLLGIYYDNPAMAVLGFTGGLLHVINHALFKSLLFLGAGSVLHATGTGELDRLGGLLKRMPVTGATFLVGAAAISGLPPLNGFVSEFLIYLGAVSGLATKDAVATASPLIAVLTVGGLALIGGLAAACFTKAFGIVFLGEPRSEAAAGAHEAGAAMQWPMVTLAGLCLLVGLSAPLWPFILQPAVAAIIPESMRHASAAGAGAAIQPLTDVMFGSYVLLGLIVLLVHVRRRLLAGRRVEQSVTWDCGYAAPTPRMQYTASSFARPLTLLFRLFLQPHDEIDPPQGLFPALARLHTQTPDLFRRYVYQPLFVGIAWAASKLRWLQEGRIQIYVLYIALTIFVLLIWKLR
ncbi:MAG: proton-conducting transporter membrane subunit [Thermoguttaceae bacterium]